MQRKLLESFFLMNNLDISGSGNSGEDPTVRALKQKMMAATRKGRVTCTKDRFGQTPPAANK